MDELTSKSSNPLGVPVAIVLAGAIMAAALYFRGGTTGISLKPSPAVSPQVAGQQLAVVNIPFNDKDPILGNKDAPVTMVEFSDFECPYCKQFQETTFPLIKKNYIDTGKVRFIYKDFPLSQIHPRAQASADAAQCANAQGKFWEYADILFKQQPALADADLSRYATDMGLDTTAFQNCVKAGTYRADIAADQQVGISVQVAGTPAFAINGKRIDGALPWEQFKQALDAALAAKQ